MGFSAAWIRDAFDRWLMAGRSACGEGWCWARGFRAVTDVAPPMPRVSVVIPTQGRASLSCALDSVFRQTEPDFEVIVVDDHAPPGRIAETLGGRVDPRLRCVTLSGRGGAAAARNRGISCATADYIAFLDDDDEWLPDKLATQMRVIDECGPGVGAVYTARLTIDRDSGRTTTTRFPVKFRPGVSDNVVTTSSVLLRRECLERVGVFDEQLAIGSDYDMWIRIGREYAFHYLDTVLVKYYVHQGNLSHDYRRQRQAFIQLLEKHSDFFALNPEFLARQHAMLGTMYLRDARVGQALSAFWRGVCCTPRDWKAYARPVRALARRLGRAFHRPADTVARSAPVRGK
jgi:glycosyltransferase involved in cell wall biosynthesis